MTRPTLLLAAAFTTPAAAADAPPPRPVPDFARDVRPVLAAHCAGCHGPQKQRGGLRLDRKADALAGGDSGPVVRPGDPDASLLLKRVTAADPAERMPPDAPLHPAAVAALRGWVAGGAPWPADAPATDPADWWSFRPVVRPPVPTANPGRQPGGAVHNPIDAFVLAKLSPAGLAMNPEAERRTLLRRLKFDLLGLPPTPAEVEAFAADRSPDAYEKRVDEYLASPHYGERWARHWLDVVRFAESHGFEMNQERPNAWPYRDWVIRSLNADKPYDRFVKEQLAGDALGADEATGFLVGGPWDQVKSPDPVLTANQRADELHDMVGTTGGAFLGLTVGCARCHNHKFDPVSQADYYRLAAAFAGVRHGERPWATADPAGREKEAAAVKAELAAADAELLAAEPLADPKAKSPRRPAVGSRGNVERFAPVPALAVRFVILATNSAEPCLDELEVFTAGPKPQNVALATAGAKVRSGGDWPGNPSIHRLDFLTDGKSGNSRSWIAAEVGRGWCEVVFPRPVTIDRVGWARDRDGKYADRTPTRYRVDVWTPNFEWVTVATSDDRAAAGTATKGGDDELSRLVRKRDELRARLGRLEQPGMVYAGKFGPPDATFRLHRGDPTQKREPVAPGVIAALGPKFAVPAAASDAERRRALADWIAHPDNPLTARVVVNRLWQGHFGTGIVDTPSDFGRNGGTPTHPELLDWLAAELVRPTASSGAGRSAPLSPSGRGAGGEGTAPTRAAGDTRVGGLPLTPNPSPRRGEGDKNPTHSVPGKHGGGGPWSLKHLHRLIVTSAAYRQSSAASAVGLAKDAQARLLWRFPPRRLEAEAVRDSVLFVTGKLDLTAGGPGFSLFEPNANYVRVYTPKTTFGPPEFRRMVYLHKTRMQLDDTFGAFDCPDAGQVAPRRAASTTPLQALNLLNAPFAVQQAGFLAERVAKEAGPDPAARVRHAFRLAFQRDPSAAERTAAVKLVEAHGLPALARALLNANEFLYVD